MIQPKSKPSIQEGVVKREADAWGDVEEAIDNWLEIRYVQVVKPVGL